jgi:hypothetical protein
MLERNMEEQQKKEVELQTAKKSEAGRVSFNIPYFSTGVLISP